MKLFDIQIENQHFQYVDSITWNEKNYIAYTDDTSLYISEYTLEDEQIILHDIEDETYQKLLKELSL